MTEPVSKSRSERLNAAALHTTCTELAAMFDKLTPESLTHIQRFVIAEALRAYGKESGLLRALNEIQSRTWTGDREGMTHAEIMWQIANDALAAYYDGRKVRSELGRWAEVEKAKADAYEAAATLVEEMSHPPEGQERWHGTDNEWAAIKLEDAAKAIRERKAKVCQVTQVAQQGERDER